MKKLLLLILVGAVTVYASSFSINKTISTYNNGKDTVGITITTSGDIAQSVKVHTFTARDSFAYKDTINDTPFVWVSPLQVMRITIAADGAVPDTAINYVCSLDAGTNVYGFVYDPSGLDDTTVALLIDNLVDSINNVAGIKDTVVAHDSVSYIKVISKFAMDNLEADARWTLIVVDSVQKGDSNQTTIAMVCDSMAAKINGNATIAALVTAANSGDTVYTVVSDDPGLAYTIAIGDTAQDTSLVQANVTTWSATTDTINLLEGNYDNSPDIRGAYVKIIMDSSNTASQGVGLSDSVWLRLSTQFAGVYTTLAQDSAAAMPCTLFWSKPEAAGTDTLFKHGLYLIYTIKDSASDTNFFNKVTLNTNIKLITD